MDRVENHVLAVITPGMAGDDLPTAADHDLIDIAPYPDIAMAMPRDDRQKDLLRPALEAIIDLGHPLVRLAREIDWEFLDQLCRRLHARCWSAAVADAAGCRAVHPEAHARPVGRDAVRALAGEPVLPVLN
jgi:IS5 family transposase